MSDSREQRLRENIEAVRSEIALAAETSGRGPEAVRLVGVTKYVQPEVAELVVRCGIRDLGESRPQQLVEKVEHFQQRDASIRWHLIGQLQRNKARRVLPIASVIQSADRWKLIEFLDSLAKEMGIARVNVFLEVNISGDQNKHGFTSKELPQIITRLEETPRIHALGLMTMGGRDATEAELHRQFAGLRELRNKLMLDGPPNAPLAELSMGMSGDFSIAIAEGSTMVRIGSRLYDGLDS